MLTEVCLSNHFVLLLIIIDSNILLASAALWGSLFTKDPCESAESFVSLHTPSWCRSVVAQTVEKVLPYIAMFQSVQALGSWVDTILRTIGRGVSHLYQLQGK